MSGSWSGCKISQIFPPFQFIGAFRPLPLPRRAIGMLGGGASLIIIYQAGWCLAAFQLFFEECRLARIFVPEISHISDLAHSYRLRLGVAPGEVTPC